MDAAQLRQLINRRLQRLRAALAAEDLDALVVTAATVRYWLGQPGSGPLVITAEQITPVDTPEEVGRLLAVLDAQQCGYDQSLSLRTFQSWRAEAGSWRCVSDLIDGLQVVKDPAEIALIRRAGALTAQALAAVAPAIEPGCSEMRIKSLLAEAIADLGGDGFAFDPSVGSGRRSALTWAGATTQAVESPGVLLLDFGAAVRGYLADMSRTYLFGVAASPKHRRLAAALDAAKVAHAEVLAQIKPGAHGADLAETGERVLAARGFGGMPHALGHGIGTAVHQRPYLHHDSTDVLESGMVVAIEPSVVLEGVGGVRVEDTVLVTDSGNEVLTRVASEPAEAAP